MKSGAPRKLEPVRPHLEEEVVFELASPPKFVASCITMISWPWSSLVSDSSSKDLAETLVEHLELIASDKPLTNEGQPKKNKKTSAADNNNNNITKGIITKSPEYLGKVVVVTEDKAERYAVEMGWIADASNMNSTVKAATASVKSGSSNHIMASSCCFEPCMLWSIVKAIFEDYSRAERRKKCNALKREMLNKKKTANEETDQQRNVMCDDEQQQFLDLLVIVHGKAFLSDEVLLAGPRHCLPLSACVCLFPWSTTDPLFRQSYYEENSLFQLSSVFHEITMLYCHDCERIMTTAAATIAQDDDGIVDDPEHNPKTSALLQIVCKLLLELEQSRLEYHSFLASRHALSIAQKQCHRSYPAKYHSIMQRVPKGCVTVPIFLHALAEEAAFRINNAVLYYNFSRSICHVQTLQEGQEIIAKQEVCNKVKQYIRDRKMAIFTKVTRAVLPRKNTSVQNYRDTNSWRFMGQKLLGDHDTSEIRPLHENTVLHSSILKTPPSSSQISYLQRSALRARLQTFVKDIRGNQLDHHLLLYEFSSMLNSVRGVYELV